MMKQQRTLCSILLSVAFFATSIQGFVPNRAIVGVPPSLLFAGTTTVEPPTKEKIYTSTSGEQFLDEDDSDDQGYGDLEYLIDSAESREMEDPFHILLMGSTFEKPRITVKYVSGSLEYVLDMPRDEATELSQFAHDEGMSCLGTWPREECLSLGKQLQRRDLVCRVVPFVEGGQRGWQAKDANSSSGVGSSSGSSSSSSSSRFD